MAEYCNSKELESNWYNWLLAKNTPHLEEYRYMGLLWTNVIGEVVDDNGIVVGSNPRHPIAKHCIALSTPLYFQSDLSKPGALLNASYDIPTNEINLVSNSSIHKLSTPLNQSQNVIPKLVIDGFIKEVPTAISWHAMLHSISNICSGISKKFKLHNEEDQDELAADALLQVTNKLISGTLVYTPGKAPVFNLLTTTIYRCMYSILNKHTKYRNNISKLATELQSGTIISNNRSLKREVFASRS